MNLHAILKDPECKGNIQCLIWGICTVFIWLSVMLYGLAWLSTVEKENTAFYGAKHLENRIDALEAKEHIIVCEIEKFRNHKHNYSTGLPYIENDQHPKR